MSDDLVEETVSGFDRGDKYILNQEITTGEKNGAPERESHLTVRDFPRQHTFPERSPQGPKKAVVCAGFAFRSDFGPVDPRQPSRSRRDLSRPREFLSPKPRHVPQNPDTLCATSYDTEPLPQDNHDYLGGRRNSDGIGAYLMSRHENGVLV